MNQALTPHYAQELRRLRRRKGLRQLRRVIIGMTIMVVVPLGLLVLLGMTGL